MPYMVKMGCLAAAGTLILAGCASMTPGPKDMTFFVTSVGSGKGGDLGGLEGADRHCQSLAKAAGAGDRVWRAYLSTQASKLDAPDFVNARDRIGTGPWQNAKGAVIARSVEDLHSANNNLNKQTTLDEKGQLVNGRTEKPNKHDMLTGSQTDGRAYPAADGDRTCRNWTSNAQGGAQVGHHDRTGWPNTSWNSAHVTRGCSQENLVAAGGAGLFYCFAIDPK